jgi:ubiquinone/menaquinone biosynthesis C-methylase UbiE
MDGGGVSKRTYLPAAGTDWLLPIYDPITKLLGVRTVHRRLIEQAALLPGDRVLEIGSGTGNLSIQAKRLQPEAEIIGMDPDPKALTRARRKAERAGAAVRFDQGFSEELPYPDGSFDKVLSALMFHHLQPDAKKLSLVETRRVLRPGGSFHIVDFSDGTDRLGGFLARSHGFLARLLHQSHGYQPDDTVIALMREAGLREPRELDRQTHILGQITYFEASAASPSAVPG